MNENLEKAVAKAIELAEKTGEFAIEQAPEIIQEFYNWQIMQLILCIFICCIVMLIFVKNYKYWFEKASSYDDDELVYIVLLVTFGFFSIGSIPLIILSLFDLVKILVAPKLYLIEYFLR